MKELFATVLKYLTKQLHDVEKTIKEIYDDNTDFLYAFSDINLPHLDSTTCKRCIYVPFCHGCLLRGFLKAQDIKAECIWYKETVPEIVKKHFPI